MKERKLQRMKLAITAIINPTINFFMFSNTYQNWIWGSGCCSYYFPFCFATATSYSLAIKCLIKYIILVPVAWKMTVTLWNAHNQPNFFLGCIQMPSFRRWTPVEILAAKRQDISCIPVWVASQFDSESFLISSIFFCWFISQMVKASCQIIGGKSNFGWDCNCKVDYSSCK